MKKGVVVVLLLLAVVVLISPAIVGRYAENSMSENIDWAARESGDLTVTAESFERGWFSSEGRHRIEIEDGDLLTAIQALTGPALAGELPVLIVDTKLDHGLIPVSSMSREHGSLAPGLGSAISTLSLEGVDGEVVALPGTIFSEIGLGGELNSHYELESGSFEDGGTVATWGATNINLQTDPKNGDASFDGAIGALSVGDAAEQISLEQLSFEGEQRSTRYGVKVGNVAIELDNLAVASGVSGPAGLQSMSLNGKSDIDDGDYNAEAFMHMVLHENPMMGAMTVDTAFTLEGADAELLGRVQQGFKAGSSGQDPAAAFGLIEDDLMSLFAAGFSINFEQLDVTLPTMGTVTSKVHLTFNEDDPTDFGWSSLLLSAEASIDLSIPEGVVDMMVQAEPNIAMAIGAGYLVKNGDAYELDAKMKKGLLTVNGAPIPIPFDLLTP